MSKKTKYKRKHALNGTHESAEMKMQLIESAKQTGKDIVVGVIAGGLTGMILGKSSLLIGAGITGYGHFSGKPMARLFGMGMMMGGGMNATNQAMSGFTMDDFKARAMSFKEGFVSKLYLDKVFKTPPAKTTATTTATNGMGEIDLSALEKLEQRMLQSGADYQKKNEASMQNSTEQTNTENTAKKEEMGSSYAEMIDDHTTSF